MAFLNAMRVSGLDVFAQAVALERGVKSADIIVTGEGRLDATSKYCNGCFAWAQLGRKQQRPIWTVRGQVEAMRGRLPFTRVASLVSAKISSVEAKRFARLHVRATLKELMK